MQTRDSFWRPLDQAELPLSEWVARQRAPGPAETAIGFVTKAGEHGVLWHAIGFAGQALDRPRRASWRIVNVAVLAAYLTNTGCKLIARRHRPPLGAVKTPTVLSFPSAHAATAAAAATALRGLLPRWLVLPLAIAVPATRFYFGVHYVTDLLAGAVLGRLVARATLGRWPATADSSQLAACKD